MDMSVQTVDPAEIVAVKDQSDRCMHYLQFRSTTDKAFYFFFMFFFFFFFVDDFFFQLKSVGIFLISTWKHVMGTH